MSDTLDPRLFPFMRRPKGEQTHETEAYVSIPPALMIQDGQGNMWTLGFDQGGWRTGEFEFDVVVASPPQMKPRKTGEMACRIEYRAGKVRIYGSNRWRTWNGRTFI